MSLNSSDEILHQPLLQKHLEEKKKLLERKHAEINDLNLQIGNVKSTLVLLGNRELDEGAIEEVKLKIEKENVLLFEEKHKADLLKETNINDNNFIIYGSNNSELLKSTSLLDNLIKSILDLAEGKINAISLVNRNDSQSSRLDEERIADQETLNKIQKIKMWLFIKDDDTVTINQSLVDRICSKIIENKMVKNDGVASIDQNLILLNENDSESVDRRKIILYEENGDYLILKQREDENGIISDKSITDSAHNVINSLIHPELIDEICRLKYIQKGIDFLNIDLEKLFNTFKEIKNDLAKKGEDEEKLFVEYLKNIEDKKTITAKIVSKQIKKMVDLFSSCEEYSEEHNSIKSGIKYLKQLFLKRLELLIQEECERRQKQAEINIKSEDQAGNIQIEIEKKQKEINDIDKELSKKDKELKAKIKELEEMTNQVNLLNESWGKQDRELSEAIESLQIELKQLEAEFNELKQNEKADEERVAASQNAIKEIKTKLKELNENKKTLKNNANELKESYELMLKDKACLLTEYAKLDKEKKHKEGKLKELKSSNNGLLLWAKFLEDVYSEFLNNRDLFHEREAFNNYIFDWNKDLHEKYRFLVENVHLKKYHTEQLEIESKYQKNSRHGQFESYFKYILSPPLLTRTNPETVEITGMNLNYEDADKCLKHYISNQLAKAKLKITTEKDETYLTIDESVLNSQPILLGSYLNGDIEITPRLKDALDRHLKSFYLVKNKSASDKGHLNENTEIAGLKEKKLGNLKMKDVLNNLKISFSKVMRCYTSTIKLIAGNNIYIDKRKEIELHGINIALIAQNDIVLAKGLKIDTSGEPGQEYKNNPQAFCIENVAAEMLKPGLSGEDGYDGFSGDNAGQVYIKADGQIYNLTLIDSILCKGGNGSCGQKGGSGQKGGIGANTDDAKCDDIGTCYFNPGFSAAFARIPGLNPNTGKYENTWEMSGRGGDAGKAGFGGEGGNASDIFIKDNQSFIKYNKEKEKFEFSSNLTNLNEKLICLQGENGTNGSTDVNGGEPGEPGTYGLDETMYCDGGFMKNKTIKGKYYCIEIFRF